MKALGERRERGRGLRFEWTV
eukprot:SAG31_NODE_31841_length_363_cov_0.977273_1_plen_20_part_10